MALPSPCTQVCEIDAARGWCRGCARALDEIAGWGSAPEPVQRAILDRLPARRALLMTEGRWLAPTPEL
jgi:uncharacterized protein